MDITHIPMARGFVHLAAVMDGASCTDAVEEAIARYGAPETFNTDQGSQFTSADFTGLLTAHAVSLSGRAKPLLGSGRLAHRLGTLQAWHTPPLSSNDAIDP